MPPRALTFDRGTLEHIGGSWSRNVGVYVTIDHSARGATSPAGMAAVSGHIRGPSTDRGPASKAQMPTPQSITPPNSSHSVPLNSASRIRSLGKNSYGPVLRRLPDRKDVE